MQSASTSNMFENLSLGRELAISFVEHLISYTC